MNDNESIIKNGRKLLRALSMASDKLYSAKNRVEFALKNGGDVSKLKALQESAQIEFDEALAAYEAVEAEYKRAKAAAKQSYKCMKWKKVANDFMFSKFVREDGEFTIESVDVMVNERLKNVFEVTDRNGNIIDRLPRLKDAKEKYGYAAAR